MTCAPLASRLGPTAAICSPRIATSPLITPCGVTTIPFLMTLSYFIGSPSGFVEKPCFNHGVHGGHGDRGYPSPSPFKIQYFEFEEAITADGTMAPCPP